MEEQAPDSNNPPHGDPHGRTCLRPLDGRPYLLAISFENGEIFLMRVFDDLIPQVVQTGLVNGIHMDWTNSGQLLAVAGCQATVTGNIANLLQFYDETGLLMYRVSIPSLQVLLIEEKCVRYDTSPDSSLHFSTL